MTDYLAVGVQVVQIFCTNDKKTITTELNFMTEYFIFKLAASNSEKGVKMRKILYRKIYDLKLERNSIALFLEVVWLSRYRK